LHSAGQRTTNDHVYVSILSESEAYIRNAIFGLTQTLADLVQLVRGNTAEGRGASVRSELASCFA